ncbi:MAG TPA: NADH-quinone oxidoreductase subunit D [Candidatus Omnitrophota bacterium]|nr:NADH-quinone oxidoreductase subunit D [Candidatus Omnitrophota bacterium]HRY85463.1 NADH-quinone oxidoreductase subunit D [Candidatus Omnitrophota bacterium]
METIPFSKNTDTAEMLEINFGPQHPSTHGVFRMAVQLEGEKICGLKPVFGYLHRNHEQIAENLPYAAVMPYTDRLDYVNALTNNFGYALAVEKLAGLEVPERAEYIRVIMAELARIVNHIAVIGFMLNDLGAFFTPLLYAFRERERILDIFEGVTGSRLMNNFFRFGGVKHDLTEADLAEIKKIIARFPAFLKEFEDLLTKNEILCMRCQNVGILSAGDAINAGITGPVLRASGVNYDIRKVDGYSIYNRFDFQVPLGKKGDVYDRYYVRILEIRQSLKILEQALAKIPQGEIMNKKALPYLKMPRNFKPPVGEAYGRIESPKGELGFYVVSDGTPQPWRYHVRAPSLINLTALEEMCLGQKVADAIVILGSIDIVLGETDR